MSRPIPWKSADGTRIINLCTVSQVVKMTSGELRVYTSGDGVRDYLTVCPSDVASFMTALDDASEPSWPSVHLDPIIDVDAIIERLDRLRGDMATVGGNALVEAVRELAIAIRGVGRG